MSDEKAEVRTAGATEVHDCDVWMDTDISGDSMWVSSCSCGWQGRMFDPEQHALAVEDWANHCDQVFMAATGG
jgi:hypothetical protein